jgi:type II secretory pathway pseudopilin PulG
MKKNKTYKPKISNFKPVSAFTLVEVVVALAMIAVLLFISTDITVKLIREAEKNDVRAEVDQASNFALETIKRTIRQYPSSSISQNNCQGAASCLTVDTKQFLYSSNKIIQRESGQPDKDLLGDKVYSTSNLSFNIANGFVEINSEFYDSRQIVYTSAVPLRIVTGAVVRTL